MPNDFRTFEEVMSRMIEELGNVWGMQGKTSLQTTPFGTSLTIGRKQPYIDVVETDKEIVATAEMPGLKKEDININLTDDRLEISAETKYDREKKENDYIYRERRSGNYYRTLSLPSLVDSNSAKAYYSDGILEVKMPKKEIKKKTSIKIE